MFVHTHRLHSIIQVFLKRFLKDYICTCSSQYELILYFTFFFNRKCIVRGFFIFLVWPFCTLYDLLCVSFIYVLDWGFVSFTIISIWKLAYVLMYIQYFFKISFPPCWNIYRDAGNFKPNLNSSMIQDLGYHHWKSDAETCLTNKDMSERHLLKALFQADLNSTSAQSHPSYGGKGVPSRGNFSQIYPSINVSNLNHSSPSPAISSMQYLNQLTSTTQSYSGNWSQCTSQDHGLGEFTENLFCGLDQMQHSIDRSSSCNNSSNVSISTSSSLSKLIKHNGSIWLEPNLLELSRINILVF